MNYLTDAFKAMDMLNEEAFDPTPEGAEELSDFLSGDIDDTIDIIDPNAETEEELEDSYVGKIILDCCVCHSKLYKDKDEITLDEEAEIANPDEECPFCYSTEGFKIIGEVTEVEPEDLEETDEVEVKAEKDGEEVEVETEVKDELSEAKRPTIKKSRRINETAKQSFVKRFLEKKSKLNEAKFKLTDEDKAYLKEFGETEKDFPQIERAANVAYYGLSTPYSFGGAKISLEDAIEELGREGFLSAIRRAAFHRTTLRNGKNGNQIKIDASRLWKNESADKTSKTDRIDAKRDDKVEKAKKSLEKADDDADSLKDMRKKRAKAKFEKELDDADADRDDMKKNEGLESIKINTGDQEIEVKAKEDGSEYDDDFGDSASFGTGEEEISPIDDPDALMNEIEGDEETPAEDETTSDESTETTETEETAEEETSTEEGDGGESDPFADMEDVEISEEEETENTTKQERLITRRPRSLNKVNEEIDSVTLNTGAQEIEVTTRKLDNTDETFSEDTEENSIDVDVDEIDEESFDSLGEKFLTKTYGNVKSYRTTSATSYGNKLKLEGIIRFASGKQKKTSFIFESKDITRSGKARFIGENVELSRGHRAFTVSGRVSGGKFIPESLSYRYKAKDKATGASQKVFGSVKI